LAGVVNGAVAVVGEIGHSWDMAKPLDWKALLVEGHEPLQRRQRVFRRLPHAPRCKLCHSPFAGIGGKLLALAGRKPSRKNPNLCTTCFENLPSGGIEIDIGVVFADVRGSTASLHEPGRLRHTTRS
jgi:adenylate cyclase